MTNDGRRRLDGTKAGSEPQDPAKIERCAICGYSLDYAAAQPGDRCIDTDHWRIAGETVLRRNMAAAMTRTRPGRRHLDGTMAGFKPTDPAQRVTVTMPLSMVEYLTILGGGNLSAGVRIAAETHIDNPAYSNLKN